MRTTVRAPLVHRCPHVEEIDVGRVELVFEGEAPELHTLRHYLESFADKAATHEEVTREIAARLEVPVRTTWTTAGMEVEVTA